MADRPTIHVTYNESEERTEIQFANGDSEQLLIIALGDDLYRAEESSCFGEVSYRDVFRAVRLDHGRLRFLSIEQRSELASQSWLLSREIINSSELLAVLDRVMALGGNWEQVFGGLLLIHVPPIYADEIAQHNRSLIKSIP